MTMEKRPIPAFATELKDLAVKRAMDVKSISVMAKEFGPSAMRAPL
ncbi:hypothetical protein SAMN05216552_103444 [Pseudoduganella namucuonensis]|uniref:Uncharacterized protein n=1 Tax=Pseudoduganella namucuonensis TaxID=1035707 RepID=A0A1I7LPH7_9BURK|nr:hypothetical protein SAMN05216552_103444 [Pseudoduganella namucuonensis]